MELLDRERDRVHLLHKLRADQSAERIAAGAGDEHAAIARSNADFGLYAMKEFQELLGLARVMALVVAPENTVGFGFSSSSNDDGFDRGRTDVQANQIADAKSGALCVRVHEISAAPQFSPGSLARRALPSIRLLTCNTKLAATPATPRRRGTG